jgi:hypothetical protein
MATVTFTPYHSTDKSATKRTVAYVLDGHGNPYNYTTQYIVDGHGGKLYSYGYNVVTDAELCALQMKHYKENYRQTHPVTRGTGAKKRDIDVYQFYISFTEDEKLSQEEMLQITDEFIKKMHLDDFPVLISPHYNTDNRHVHAVIGAYNIAGTHKLSLNKEKLHNFRRNMDYICVAHGLSIVEPELPLLRDPEYAEFYHNVIENNLVPIIPRDKTKNKCSSRRKRSMQVAMDRKAIEAQIREEKERTDEIRRKSSKHYYSYSGTRLPYSHRPAYIYKYDADGRERSIPELMLMLLGTIAVGYLDIEIQHPPKNIFDQERQTIYFGKIDTIAQRSMDAIILSRKYDISSDREIPAMKQFIGQQMNHCKAVIKHQQLLLEENQIQMEMDSTDSQEYTDLAFANEVIKNRIDYQENRLKELNKEYRDMSWMEKTLQKTQFENELHSMRWLEDKQQKNNEKKLIPDEKNIIGKTQQIQYDICK